MSVVATSQRIFKGIQSREQPFFGFFATTHLQPLHTSDAVELLRRIGRHREQTDLVELLATPEGRSRVRTLHHIAGGNHRIYIVLSGVITRESLDDLGEPFEKMADEMTLYYQERMRWLSAQQLQVVEYLCRREDTCTPKEIARHLLATENEELQQHVFRRIAICHEADALDFLGFGLLRSLWRIDVDRIGLETLKSWREAWLKWGGNYPELEIPLRIFRVGIEYFLQGDEKVLLDLVALERTILYGLLLLS